MTKIIKLRNIEEVETFINKNKVTFLQILEPKTGGIILVYKERSLFLGV